MSSEGWCWTKKHTKAEEMGTERKDPQGWCWTKKHIKRKRWAQKERFHNKFPCLHLYMSKVLWPSLSFVLCTNLVHIAVHIAERNQSHVV
jgi:hypothetical protein